MIFFAIYSHEKGGWEGMRLVIAFPLYFGFGLFAIRTALYERKHGPNTICSKLLLVIAILFLTVYPALYMTKAIDNLLFWKDRAEKKENQRLSEMYKDVHTPESAITQFDQVFSNVVIRDIENDRVYVEVDTMEAVFTVKNASEIGLLANRDSFINHQVHLVLDTEYVKNLASLSQIPQSKEGALLIERNLSRQDKNALTLFKRENGRDPTMNDIYKHMYNIMGAQGDLPVTIINN
jgi:hypothetical protein